MSMQSPTTPTGPPRQTVVVRVGPPQRARRTANIVSGVLGLLLIVAAIGMVKYLPKDPVVAPQFKVAIRDVDVDYTGNVSRIGSQSFEFIEGGGDQAHDFVFDVPDDNIYSVQVFFEFKDDVDASLYDSFQVSVLDPLGNLIGGQAKIIDNSATPAVAIPLGPPLPVPVTNGYEAQYVQATIILPVAQRPDDLIVEGLTKTETLDAVTDRVIHSSFSPSAGAWTVKVRLQNAGDCPELTGSPNAETLQQIAACQQDPDASNGQDVGNELTLTAFKYTYFSVDVSELT